MVGLLRIVPRQRGKKSVEVTEKRILGVRFLCGEAAASPELTARSRTDRALRQLQKAGVTRLVPPADFRWTDRAARRGLPPVDTLPLARELAGELVRLELERKGIPQGTARVAVWAAAPSGELVRAVTELALRCRYLLLTLPWGGEELCRQLRREYGVSVQLNPGWDRMAQADATVLFDPAEQAAGEALPLYPGGGLTLPPLAVPPALEAQLPPEWDRPRLLASLREAGALRPGQITAAGGASPLTFRT